MFRSVRGGSYRSKTSGSNLENKSISISWSRRQKVSPNNTGVSAISLPGYNRRTPVVMDDWTTASKGSSNMGVRSIGYHSLDTEHEHV